MNHFRKACLGITSLFPTKLCGIISLPSLAVMLRVYGLHRSKPLTSFAHNTSFVLDWISLSVTRSPPFHLLCYSHKEWIELLRYYCVSKTPDSVHPIGYPINHSIQFGFIGPIFPSGVSSRKLLRSMSYLSPPPIPFQTSTLVVRCCRCRYQLGKLLFVTHQPLQQLRVGLAAVPL